MSATQAVGAAASSVASKLAMTSHPPVTVALVAGAITNISLKVLRATNPDIAGVLEGSEGDITLVVAALAGFLTRRAA